MCVLGGKGVAHAVPSHANSVGNEDSPRPDLFAMLRLLSVVAFHTKGKRPQVALALEDTEPWPQPRESRCFAQTSHRNEGKY